MKFEGFSTEDRRFVQTVSTSAETLLSDVSEDHGARLASRGGHFTKEQMLPVYFAALVGLNRDEAEYNNMLFNLRDSLIRSPKLLLYMENELRPPFESEILQINRPNFQLKLEGDEMRTELAIKALEEFGSKIHLTAWLLRCVSHPDYKRSVSQIPILLYYGNIGENELEFLHFMSRIGMDVLYVSSERSSMGVLRKNNLEGRMQIFELPFSKSVAPYPEKPVKAKFATHAYKAERELDTVLYDNAAVFRDFQYEKNHARTLKTTYEEIDILWHSQARYRSGFDVENNDTAIVPNLFVKISGVRDGEMTAYWDGIKQKLSPHTKIIRKTPAAGSIDFTRLFTDYKSFFYGKKIDIQRLKASPFNQYGFLPDRLQCLIFEKMQEAADSGFLKLEPVDLMLTVIHIGLSLDREMIKTLQGFDYTKDIPKIIIIDTAGEVFNKAECALLVMYNLLCFDIAVYTPTGYRNLEQYMNETAFETYTMNEFKHNLAIPDFSASPAPGLNRLFKNRKKKGRS
ncbi:MAG: YceG family protein [Oscillospiraceae bacterium]|nr:YceG family protein [Oscillospiraceae bacterium]